MRAAIVKARVNAIQAKGRHEETKSIDGPISFPLVNMNRIIVPHYDALVLTLCINEFDVHMVLIDPGSAADLLQSPAFKQMKISLCAVNSAGRILSGFNGATIVTLGDVVLLVKAGPVKSIDGPISFPLVNMNRIIVPHYDALVLTVCINEFDVHMVLIDPGSAADLL